VLQASPVRFEPSTQPHIPMSQRLFEISYILRNSSNSATQRAYVNASDTVMARRIFEQQNPACKIVSSPKDVTDQR